MRAVVYRENGPSSVLELCERRGLPLHHFDLEDTAAAHDSARRLRAWTMARYSVPGESCDSSR